MINITKGLQNWFGFHYTARPIPSFRVAASSDGGVVSGGPIKISLKTFKGCQYA
jgi:hypothetical protein